MKKNNRAESSTSNNSPKRQNTNNNRKSPFIPAKDDTKPVLQDPILRSDPIETEEAVLLIPPFSIPKSTPSSQMT